MSIVTPNGVQVMMATGTRSRFCKDKLPAQSAGRDL